MIQAYLDMHLIPREKDLKKIDRFEDFIEERKKLIKTKLSYLLSQKAEGQVGQTLDNSSRQIVHLLKIPILTETLDPLGKLLPARPPCPRLGDLGALGLVLVIGRIERQRIL